MMVMKEKKVTLNGENEKLEDLLPELNNEELVWAREPRQTAWVYNKLKFGIGYVWVDNENGFSMQVVDNGFRLLSIVNHEWPRKTVAYLEATLYSISHNLDIDNAIVIPYNENPESQNETEKNGIIEVDGTVLEVA